MKNILKILAAVLCAVLFITLLTSCGFEKILSLYTETEDFSSQTDREETGTHNTSPLSPSPEENNSSDNNGNPSNETDVSQITDVKYSFAHIGSYCIVYSSYNANGQVLAQCFYNAEQNIQNNLYCQYYYNNEGKLLRWTISDPSDGYVLEETTRAEFSYSNNSSTPTQSRTYYRGTETNDGATVEYHQNGLLKLICIGESDDPELLVTFDDQSRHVSTSFDGAAVTMNYTAEAGELAPTATLETFDFSYSSSTLSLNYTDNRITRITAEAGEASMSMDFKYAADSGVLNDYAFTLSQNGSIVEKETYSAVLDDQDRITELTIATYGKNESFKSKSKDTFSYESDGKIAEHIRTVYDESGNIIRNTNEKS